MEHGGSDSVQDHMLVVLRGLFDDGQIAATVAACRAIIACYGDSAGEDDQRLVIGAESILSACREIRGEEGDRHLAVHDTGGCDAA